MKTIYLHGKLAEEFGGPFQMDIRDAGEAVRAMCSQLEGFEQRLTEGHWHVIRGELDSDTAMNLDEDSLGLSMGNAEELHFIPAIEGAGSDVGKVVVGVVMVAAAFYTGGASLAAWSGMQIAAGAMGAGLIIAGASTMLAATPPTQSYDENSSPDERASTLFNGPINRSTQGVAIPLIYGEVITGSIVISAGISTEQVDI